VHKLRQGLSIILEKHVLISSLGSNFPAQVTQSPFGTYLSMGKGDVFMKKIKVGVIGGTGHGRPAFRHPEGRPPWFELKVIVPAPAAPAKPMRRLWASAGE
jgi:hypothetical protein